MAGVHPRVLHVEDNHFFAKVTAGVLRDDYDMDVATTGSGEAALDRLEDEAFDCIVSDYEMPGMDGLELLESAKDVAPNVPFILLTGDGSEQIASEAISAGVTDYLKKGNGREQFAVLANRIENAIARRRTEQLNERQIAVNDLVWEVSQAVLRASSREEIERIVCGRFADSDPYTLAWVGNVDEETHSVDPRAAAGIEESTIDTIVLDASHDNGDRIPVREAVNTRSVQTKQATTPETEFEIDADADTFTVAAIPLSYEDRIYGVLSVWSTVRCAFGETERRVLSKFGNNIAYAVDSVQTRKELVRREQRLQVFNRILRHNLRNDLNVVLGHAQNICEEFPPAERDAEVIKRKASELIDISEKAREVGKTLDRGDATEKQIDVTNCVERTCEEFRQAYSDIEIKTEIPESARVYADKTLEAAISEVLENAVEHTDGDPSVTVTVSTTEDDGEWVELTVLDDGPGIPEAEREVLVEGEETALHHGSGLGLWLTNWIAGKFGGELTFEDYESSGGAVTLRLQRATDDPPTRESISWGSDASMLGQE